VAQDKRFQNAKVWKPINEMDPNSFWVPLKMQKYKE
jgi:hypothetical protein